MKNKFKKVQIFILSVCLVVGLLTPMIYEGYKVEADSSNLIVRTAEDYAKVDFANMPLSDYALFFVQDINMKYNYGRGCVGKTRSSGITNLASLQDVCTSEIAGADNGIDCSAFVYLICKYYGWQGTSLGTSYWKNEPVGEDGTVSRAKDITQLSDFDDIQVGDVIITLNGSQGHALIYVGDVGGNRTLVHIGSSYMCKECETHPCDCCQINPGVGVTFCANCTPNEDAAGQNKRFVRTANLDKYFSGNTIAELTDCTLYSPIYGRSIGAGPTGTDYGSGHSNGVITEFTHKTGTLKEEGAIIGMPNRHTFDGEFISLVGRDGLAMSEIAAVSTIGDGIGYGKWTASRVISTVSVTVGYILLLYAALIMVGYAFDRSNNFVEIEMLKILSFGRWYVLDEPDSIQKTVRKNGRTYVTKKGIIIRAVIIGSVGILFISGYILVGINWLMLKLGIG